VRPFARTALAVALLERRQRDVTWKLQLSGWAVVRWRNPTTPDATPCVEPGCQEEGVVGLNIARLCLTHFDLRFGAMKASLDQVSSFRAAPEASRRTTLRSVEGGR
jgi:hypothetical protein